MKSQHIPTAFHRLLAVLFLCAVVGYPDQVDEASPANQNVVYEEDFEDGLAQGWQLEPGWQVISDGGNQVLAGQGHVWARSNQSFDSDYRLSFRLKLLNGTIHLVYRLNDVGRYFIGFHSDGSYLSRQVWPDQFQNELARSRAAYGQYTWHQIQIVGQGATLRFYVDGNQQWTYSDPQPLGNGSFAFETLENSQAYVDDIRVDMDSGQIAAPSAPTSDVPASAPMAGSPPSSTSNLTWIRTGGPLGGLGYDIRMRPDNPDRLYVTDAWAGVFASNDSGLNWFPSSDGIITRVGPSGDAIPVFSLTIDPNNPDIVWAGTQFQRGIFRSADGGRTWRKMDRGIVEEDGITFRGFTIQPGNSNIVYAAAEVSSWAWTPNRTVRMGREFDLTRGVVYKTTNGGQTWQAVWRGANLARYIWINPQNTDIVYISTGIFDREAANSDPGAGIPGGEGVLKSTDGGLHWANINNGLGNLYVGSLFMHPTDPNILLAGTGSNPYQAGEGVYITLDGGNSWTQTLDTGNWPINSVEFSQSNPDIAYAGSRAAVYRSRDGGRSWQQTTSGGFWGSPTAQTGFPIDFQVDPRDPDRILTNAYGGGAFLSEDGGRTWRDVSKGYTGAQVRDLAVDPGAPGHLVVVARSGVFASYNGGTDWVGINPSQIDSIEWNVISIDPSDPLHFIGGLNVQGWLAGSDNGGQTWTTVAGPYPDRKGWRAIAFSPSNPDIVYAGTGSYYSASYFEASQPALGIFASRDSGRSWLPANDSLSQDAHVTALAVDPSDPQAVLAGTTNHGLLKSADGGRSWMQLGGLPGSKTILSLAIQPSNPDVIFVGFERGAIFRSTDRGQTWKRSSSGLNPEASVSDILFDPTNPTQVLYLADLQSGVYRSSDGGVSWRVINSGLFSRSVNALAISSDGLHLYAASEGMGVFRLDLNGTPPESAPAPPTAQEEPAEAHPAPTIVAAVPTPVFSPVRNLPCVGGLILPLVLLGTTWLQTRPRVIRR